MVLHSFVYLWTSLITNPCPKHDKRGQITRDLWFKIYLVQNLTREGTKNRTKSLNVGHTLKKAFLGGGGRFELIISKIYYLNSIYSFLKNKQKFN